MNHMHEVNRLHWNDKLAKVFHQQDDESGTWRRCLHEPRLAFDCDFLPVIQEFIADISGKDVCLVGSGDNHAAFALAGLGANVTSIDQSEKQLEVAESRSRELGLSITFMQSDATDLNCLPSSEFDLVCSTNGFFVWISDLHSLFRELHRILKPQGFYAFYDIHPFLRPWKDGSNPIEMTKPYFETGPFQDAEGDPFFFYWTIGDLLNSLADAGFSLCRLHESPAQNSNFWEGGKWYLPGNRPNLLDWKVNPHAGLPAWLSVAVQKF